MPRRFFSTACLLGGLLCLTAHAQLPSNIPTKLSVTGARRVNVGQKTVLRVALLNQQGRETAALNDTTVLLLATKQQDIRSARADVRSGPAPRGDAFELPAGRSTVQTQATIARGSTHVAVTFSSAQAGPIRVYAESDKYATGYALIAVYEGRSGAPRAEGAGAAFVNAFFVKAAYQGEAGGPLSLFVAPDGTDAPVKDDATGEAVLKFDVLLRSGEEAVPAPRPIRVRLDVSGAPGRVEPSSLVINAGDFIGEKTVEVRTRAGGDITVVAAAVREDGLAVAPSQPRRFPFPLAKVATGLVVEAVPSEQPTTGRDPISIIVRAVDDAKNTILCKDEGLPERRVDLLLDGQGYGLKFDNGHAFVTIPRDQLSGERKIFGSRTVAGTKVKALAKNSRGEDIVGFAEIGFRFPWWQLGFALLGGALTSVAGGAARARRRQRQKTGQMLRAGLIEAGLGAAVGAIFFGLVFFGAVAVTEMKWGGVPVILDALPIQHSLFASFLVGFLGGVLIGTRSLLKSAIAGRTLRASHAG